jgi:hypothetical protein
VGLRLETLGVPVPGLTAGCFAGSVEQVRFGLVMVGVVPEAGRPKHLDLEVPGLPVCPGRLCALSGELRALGLRLLVGERCACRGRPSPGLPGTGLCLPSLESRPEMFGRSHESLGWGGHSSGLLLMVFWTGWGCNSLRFGRLRSPSVCGGLQLLGLVFLPGTLGMPGGQ